MIEIMIILGVALFILLVLGFLGGFKVPIVSFLFKIVFYTLSVLISYQIGKLSGCAIGGV